MDPHRITLAETHVSTLFFAGDRVYKLKKPVTTGFLDFSTPEARHRACRREVELNRRFAPDVYLGVAELALEGEPIDHLVVMRRMPPSRRLSSILDEPGIETELRRVAEVVAGFHATAPRGQEIDDAAGVEALLELWRTGADQLGPFVPDVLGDDEVARMLGLAEEYLHGRAPLVEQRLAAGRACDGHGDLRAEDVFCLEDGPRILDCLEFDDRLRYGDVLLDVAFLAMDLDHLGRADLAEVFLDAYRAASGDAWPPSLAHLHVAYRAHVRSKVACIRHGQGDADAAGSARSLHALALSHLERGRVPALLVGGAPGTGKSTLAEGLAQRLGAVRLSTDDLRGGVVPPSAGAAGQLHAGRYAPELVGAVYDELVERARVHLGEGVPVVLDASWSSADRRAAAREVARACSSPVVELCCTVDPDVAAERIAARAAAGGSTSEVTPEIAAELARSRDPWPEAAEVSTAPPPDAVLERAHAEVVERLARTAPVG